MYSLGNFFMLRPNYFFSFIEITVLVLEMSTGFEAYFFPFFSDETLLYISVGISVWLNPLCSPSDESVVILR